MILLLAALMLVSLLLIPIGLPGIWLMVAGAVLVVLFTPAAPFGWFVVIGCGAIALASEALDIVLGARCTKEYGGSNRGAWGAVLGGIVGAIVGVPVPIIGSVIGALVGSFVGALVAEYSVGATHEGATRAATGATIGRVVATAFKVMAGCVVAAWILGASLI